MFTALAPDVRLDVGRKLRDALARAVRKHGP